MGIRDYLARKRSAPSSPKVRVIGGKGSDAGTTRHELYKAAWSRYNEAMSALGVYMNSTSMDGNIELSTDYTPQITRQLRLM